MAKGFAAVNWPGRLEVVRRSPLVVVDGAHNPYSAQKLREALDDYFPHRKVIYVVGCSSDKNISGIIQELALNAELVVATRSRHPRSAPSRRLAAGFRSRGVAARDVDGVGAAVEYAMGCVGEENVVVVTGSLFVVAEAREALMGIPPEVYPSLTTDVAGPLVAGR
ncbi:MAG: cyanophycin synthetase [Chloroflexota bacterium]